MQASLPNDHFETLYKVNKLIYKMFHDVKRRISNYTNMKPNHFIDATRKMSHIMNLSVAEMSLLITDLTNSTVAKTFRHVCNGYRQIIDLIIDYVIKPDNLNMALDAMSMRDMRKRMQDNCDKMNKYRQMALMDPEGFVQKMDLARLRLRIPRDYVFDEEDWSTWDDENEEIDVEGIKWSKKRAKQLENEIKKVDLNFDCEYDEEYDESNGKPNGNVADYMLKVDQGAVDRLMELINSGKILDFSENKDHNIILALKNKIYTKMSREHNRQRKRLDDIIGFFDELRVTPGQTNNYLENLVEDMRSVSEKPARHEIEHKYIEDYKFRRVVDDVERDVLYAFDGKQREMVMRVMVKLNKARRKFMVNSGNHPIEKWEDVVARIQTDHMKNLQIKEKYEVMLKRQNNEKELLLNQLASLRKELKAKESVGETYQENIHELLNELKDQKYEIIKLQKDLDDKDFQMYKMKQEIDSEQKPSDDIGSLQKVHVQIDDKLGKLVGIIKELSAESRIYIDEDRNIITDHPNVEKNMFEVRGDLEKMNDHYARKNQKNGKRIFKFHNTRDLKSLNPENKELTQEKIQRRKSKLEKRKKGGKKRRKKKKKKNHKRMSTLKTRTGRKLDKSSDFGDDGSSYSDSQESRMSMLSRKKSFGVRDFNKEKSCKTPREYSRSNVDLEDKSTFCDFLKIEDSFLRQLDPIKLDIVKTVAKLNLGKSQLIQIRELFEILIDPKSTRHLDFMINLLKNDNLKLLEDVTNDGKKIGDDLVIYIKKLRNERKGTKFDGKSKTQVMNNRMSTQDNMALQASKNKTSRTQRVSTLDTARRTTTSKSKIQAVSLKQYARKGTSKMPALLPKMKSEYLKVLNSKVKRKSETVLPESPRESTVSVQTETNDEEDFIKKIYDHLHVKSKKMKIWYKYPFNSIRDFNKSSKKFGVPGSRTHRNILSDSRVQPSYDDFKDSFKSYLDRHSVCGENCPHLQRFYERIGFDPTKGGFRKKIDIPKFIIDKIILGDLDNL